MVLCMEGIMVVGHRCMTEGRKPETDWVGVIISRWPKCQNMTDVQMSSGTIGVCWIFIKDFAKLAKPLNKLLHKDIPFVLDQEQKESMKNLKSTFENAVPLGNIDYKSNGTVVLAVDTSWKAVGYYISRNGRH